MHFKPTKYTEANKFTKAKLHCESSFCDTKFLRTTPTRALKHREGKVKKNPLKVVLRKPTREGIHDILRNEMKKYRNHCCGAENISFGSGSTEPQTRITAPTPIPAPDSFTRWVP
jgi:hypothetical protein